MGFGKSRVWSVHSSIPKELKWLLVWVCVNEVGYHIPSFYIYIRVSKETTLRNVKTMLPWPCNLRHG
jgi:hypothetical protein